MPSSGHTDKKEKMAPKEWKRYNYGVHLGESLARQDKIKMKKAEI